jgi:uncharacterized membrane protein
MNNRDDNDNRYQTGCLGILIPLALVAYALSFLIWHYRRERYQFRYRSPESIEGDGITVLGIALFVHALGFVPYKRWPLLRWLLVAAGILLFFRVCTKPPLGNSSK